MIRFRFKSNTIGDPQVYYRTLVPSEGSWRTVLDMAALLGLGSDLCCVENPGGASRYGRVRALIPTDLLSELYAETASGDGGILFEWQAESGPALSMRVWLMPPSPVLWTNEGGFALVEGRDARWKGRFPAGEPTAHPLRLSDDARYKVEGHTSMLEWCEALATDAGLTVDFGSFAPDADAELLAQDLGAEGNIAPGLLLDMAMAAVGWCVQYDPLTATFGAVAIGGDMAVLGPWMQGTGRGYVMRGGVGATVDDPDGSNGLLDAMDAPSSVAGAWMPASPWLYHGQAIREGDTRFSNQDAPDDPYASSDGGTPTTDRTLGGWRRAGLRLPATFPGDDENIPVVPWSSPTAAAAAASEAWGRRAGVAFGSTAWRGWCGPPPGSYRQTECTWRCGLVGGAAVPVTVTRASVDDWTLGPNGELASDPAGLVLGRGNAFPLALWNGATLLRVAPPQVRVFKARITGSTQRVGLWVWDYDWEEVEPDGTGGWAHDADSMRSSAESGTAEDTAERGNAYGTFIWPGVTVADYAPAVVDCLPVADDGIVDMIELAPTVYPLPDPDDERPPPYSYSFCVQNAPLFSCA